MNKQALLHRAKSEYAYAYDKETLHITLRTGKGDFKAVSIVYGDPFNWEKDVWVKYEESMNKRYETELFDYYFIAIKPEDLRSKYAFILEGQNGESLIYGSKKINTLTEDWQKTDLTNFFNFPYLNKEDLQMTPSWVKDIVWYQIFPDRFYTENPKLKWGKLPVSNDDIFGGDLKGIQAKIPYLKELGITGIYFTPIFESRTAHKYDTTNYFKIDPSFGTNEDFKELVDACHANDIKIMLDGVFNHSGFLHPFFQDVAKNNENSIYKNSFYIDKFPVITFDLNDQGVPARHTIKDINFKTFAYTPHMPKWNTDDKLTQEHLLEVIRYWIEEYNIDGWRLDVSNEVSHDFLRQIKIESRKANKETFILGENWDQSLAWLNGDQLDSVMNYDLSYPIWEYLQHSIDLTEFKSIVNTYLATTPKNYMDNMFNLIDSHDVIRILRRLNDNKDRTKLAYLFMFLSAGAPNIYYGGEVGLTGEHDPDNRRTMIWEKENQDLEFFEFMRKLIELRKQYTTFAESDYNFLDSDLLAFTKSNDKETILVVINNNNENRDFVLPNHLKGEYKDLFTNKNASYDKIELQPYKFILLKKEN